MSNQAIKQGLFKKELKNRFLCLVEIDGEDTLCYIPSSCRLSNFIDLAGKSVLLLPVKTPNSRTKYAIFALRVRGRFVLLNLSIANDVIEENIRKRRFSVLGKRTQIKKEYTIDGYKSDLFISDTKTVVEVKSLLSFDNEVLFPSIYSQRAIDQLIKLNLLLDKGYKVCYVIVSLNPKVKRIVLNSVISDFAYYFKQCVDKGMIVKGIALKMKDGVPAIHSNLDVQL